MKAETNYLAVSSTPVLCWFWSTSTGHVFHLSSPETPPDMLTVVYIHLSCTVHFFSMPMPALRGLRTAKIQLPGEHNEHFHYGDRLSAAVQ